MNEKTNLQDLAALVAEKSGIAIKDVEYFLRELIDTIQQALLNDEPVRIKGLGTFKRLTVSARESVDVTTGNRVVIPAHYKINFIPDNNLAQAVNEPFAPFDTIEFEGTSPSETKEAKINIVNEKYVAERRPVTVEEPPRFISNPDKINPIPDKSSYPSHGHRKRPRNKRWLGSVIFLVLVLVGLGCVGYFFILDTADRWTHPSNKASVPKYSEMIRKDTAAIENIIQEEAEEEDIVQEDIITEDIITEDIVAEGIVAEDIVAEDILEEDMGEDIVEEIITKEDSKNTVTDNTVKTPEKNVEKKIAEVPAVKTGSNETTATIKRYTLQQGDRLTTIALREYGNKVFWVYLYEENRDKIKNPNIVPAGLTIQIPPAAKYGINKDNPESVRKASALQGVIQQ